MAWWRAGSCSTGEESLFILSSRAFPRSAAKPRSEPVRDGSKVEGYFRGHAGLENAFRIRHLDLDAEHLMSAFVHALHISWRKLTLAGDLADSARQNLFRIGIDRDAHLLVQAEFADFRFRHIDFHP